MPRLIGHRERNPVNYYDLAELDPERKQHGWLATYRDSPAPTYRRLFRYRTPEEGRSLDPSVSNVFGVINYENTFIVTSIYARTSMPPSPERDAIADQMIATLEIGGKPMRQMSVREMLMRTEATNLEELKAERLVATENLAAMAYNAYEQHRHSDRPIGIGDTWPLFPTLAEWQRARWIAVADEMYRALKPRPFSIIPPRQSFGVCLDNTGPGFGNHKLWVHLAGVASRDAC